MVGCCCWLHGCSTCRRTCGWMAVLVGVNGLTDASAICLCATARSPACAVAATMCGRRTVNGRQFQRRSNFEVRRCERAIAWLLCRSPGQSTGPDPFPCDFSCVLVSTLVSDVCLDYYWPCVSGVRPSTFTTQMGVVRKLEWSIKGRVRGHRTSAVELRVS